MFKEGDIVWLHPSESDGGFLSTLDENTACIDYLMLMNAHHLTVAEAFEMVGIEVKGKLTFENCEDWFNAGCCVDGSGWTSGPGPHPDLSRLPTADCWDALPGVVREAVEKKLEEGK